MLRRTFLLTLSAILMLGILLPAQATSVSGHVAAPMPFVFGAPRVLQQTNGSLDQIVGDVITLPGTGIAHGTSFTVSPVAPTGPVQFEIEFYTSLSGSGPCDPSAPGLTGGWVTGGGKSGTIDCDGAKAKYAIVVLIYGADADFNLSW